MRREQAFILLGALAAVAPTCPGHSQERRALIQIASAHGHEEGPSNRIVDSIRTTLGRDGEEDSGNPLWAVPLSALLETRERPLFSSSRRPPSSDPPPTVAPQPAPDPTPAARSEPEQPPLALIGTIIGPAGRIALVQESGTQAVTKVRVGEENGGWRVRSVAARSIVVEKGALSVTLGLPKPSDDMNRQPPLEEKTSDNRNRH
jgi:hypothetical protein